MIATVLEITLRRLRHSPVELLLTFVVPVVFFSIFALIFSRGLGSTPTVRTLLVDGDGSDLTAQLMEQLEAGEGLKTTRLDVADLDAPAMRSEAERQVREGVVTAAILFPPGYAETAQTSGNPPTIPVLVDSANPVAEPFVQSLLSQAIGATLAAARGQGEQPILPDGQPAAASENEPPPLVATSDVVGEGKSNSRVASYAAGIAVLFLLFSAAGSGGSLLEEEESGTLERLLSSRLAMPQLLLGKWLSIVLIGTAQVTVMFIWGHYVFGLDLWNHLPGFAAMTLATTAAAASFALVLATLCRSRTQLSGISTILILSMSALGGSMVPRYLMSDSMQEWGLLTFNAWALDGYEKVFWRDLPVEALTPQLTVLVCLALGLLILARLFARRWECV